MPVAAGLLSALLFLSLSKGVPFGMLLSYLAPLPVLMAGLALGQGAAATAGLAGALAVWAGTDAIGAVPFVVAVVLPAAVVANRGLLWRGNPDGSVDWYPPGWVLAWLAVTAIGLIAAAAVLVPSHPDGIKGWVVEMIGRTLELLAPDVPAEKRQVAVGWWTPLFPALVAGSWLLMVVVNATIAERILRRLGRSLRPAVPYRDLGLPGWSGIVLAGSTGVALMAPGTAGYLAQNVAVVALLPFVFLGLAAVHTWAAGRPQARLFLAAFYVTLLVAFAWVSPLVAGFGLLRFWKTNLRQPPQGGGEEEG